jgi:general secretion pathway protein A
VYEEFYGFAEKPFQIVPNPDYLYFTPKHKNALSCLEYGLNDNVGFILLTGEIGSGKTTLIRYLLNNIDAGIVPSVIFNTNVTAEEFFIFVMQSFDLKYSLKDKAKNLELLYKFMLEQYVEGNQVLLIIDEAQNLSDSTLEEIRMLSNFQSEDRLLLQIILVGQPELRARFKNPSLAQFRQRIAVNYHLQALTQKETKVYITFRMKKAGGRVNIFTADAMDLIYRASRGIPRTINLLCDSALVYGFAEEVTEIDTQIVNLVIKELGFMGLFDKRNLETVPETSVTDKIEGNGFVHRLEKMEGKINKIQLELNQRNEKIERAIKGLAKALRDRLKVYRYNERKRIYKLKVENKRLKQQLKVLDGGREERYRDQT